MKITNAIAFCDAFITKYKQKAHVDYLICGESIKIFFYFKSKELLQHSEVVDELNHSLLHYGLLNMCDFYMKLIQVHNCEKYDLCWVFLSFSILGDYYVQRLFWP